MTCQFCGKTSDHIKGQISVCTRCSKLVDKASANTITNLSKTVADELGARWLPGFEDLSK